MERQPAGGLYGQQLVLLLSGAHWPVPALQQEGQAYIAVPQPSLNQLYNTFMGGVDLLVSSKKKYAISTRVKKLYWCLYTWFLNVSMLQAWRLFRAHKKDQHRLVQEQEAQEELERQIHLDHAFKHARGIERGGMQIQMENISFLNFTRQVVEMTIQRHSVIHKIFQRARWPGSRSDCSLAAISSD